MLGKGTTNSLFKEWSVNKMMLSMTWCFDDADADADREGDQAKADTGESSWEVS